eukprot:gene11205-12380_t
MIVLYIAQSLDGFIAGPDGSVSWLDEFNEPEAATGYNDFVKDVEVVVMGRKSYDQVLTFPGPWPYVGKKCFVFTTSTSIKEPPEDADVTRADHKDVHEFVNKECQGKRVWLLGGAALVKAFLEANVIDEFMLTTFPKIIGKGIRLFLESDVRMRFKCTKSELGKNGAVDSTYCKSD